jgi:hypothetical protein
VKAKKAKCVICGKKFLKRGTVKTCGEECRKARMTLKQRENYRRKRMDPRKRKKYRYEYPAKTPDQVIARARDILAQAIDETRADFVEIPAVSTWRLSVQKTAASDGARDRRLRFGYNCTQTNPMSPALPRLNQPFSNRARPENGTPTHTGPTSLIGDR